MNKNSIDIAMTLGYIFTCKEYENEGQRLHDVAMRGKYRSGKRWTDLPLQERAKDDPETVEIWDKVCEAQRCLRCIEPACIIRHEPPFCISCRRHLNECSPSCAIEVVVSDQRKKEIRQRFAFLSKVPNGYRSGDPCYFCDLTKIIVDDSERAQSLASMWTWHFGERKRCCTLCLHKQFEKNQVIGLESIYSAWNITYD